MAKLQVHTITTLNDTFQDNLKKSWQCKIQCWNETTSFCRWDSKYHNKPNMSHRQDQISDWRLHWEMKQSAKQKVGPNDRIKSSWRRSQSPSINKTLLKYMLKQASTCNLNNVLYCFSAKRTNCAPHKKTRDQPVPPDCRESSLMKCVHVSRWKWAGVLFLSFLA